MPIAPKLARTKQPDPASFEALQHMPLEYDDIGPWSEMKLEIVKAYAEEYSKILTAKKRENKRFHHLYIDAFAGPGVHLAKATGEFVPGSPLNALNIQPPFDEIHLIDADQDRTAQLKQLAGDRKGVHVYSRDCHEILLSEVFPRARYEDYGRALCLLDPYSLDLSWDLVKAAGQSRTIEIFLNFMIMDANRNPFRREPTPDQQARMTKFWGDESWRQAIQTETDQRNLFSGELDTEKSSNQAIAEAYRQRLIKVAGFQYVAQPVAMKNKIGKTVYYLYFASPNKTGHKIATHILDKYRNQP